MEYSTLMVHLELERSNDACLRITGDLAERFDCAVIGIAACDHSPPPYYADGSFAQSLIVGDRERLTTRMAELEERFTAALQNRAKALEWRSALKTPTEYVAQQARAADLIIVAPSEGGILDPFRCLDTSSLLMQAGRPVLIAQPQIEWLRLQHVLLAWKDTREARRAAWDALPLLQAAKEVTVIEVLEGEGRDLLAEQRLQDVCAWLRRHNVEALGRTSTGLQNAPDRLEDIASDMSADLIVAGAYGHHRLREWVFGGVTKNLLQQSDRCVLLTH